ncbi:MAG: hypothetical protein CM15mP107_2270 [Bacteroidota bacterium]|nr:MAG: hypothetical protein CM15mP107_2270 [Bacteroidota bacterium]
METSLQLNHHLRYFNIHVQSEDSLFVYIVNDSIGSECNILFDHIDYMVKHLDLKRSFQPNLSDSSIIKAFSLNDFFLKDGIKTIIS